MASRLTASVTGVCLDSVPGPPDPDPGAGGGAGAESELGARLQRAGEAQQPQRGRAQHRGAPPRAPALLHSHLSPQTLILVIPQTRGGGDHMVPSQLNRVIASNIDSVSWVSLTCRPPQVTRVPRCSRVTVTMARPGLDNVTEHKRPRSVTDRDNIDIV